jgi:hypothetical protein
MHVCTGRQQCVLTVLLLPRSCTLRTQAASGGRWRRPSAARRSRAVAVAVAARMVVKDAASGVEWPLAQKFWCVGGAFVGRAPQPRTRACAPAPGTCQAVAVAAACALRSRHCAHPTLGVSVVQGRC